MSVYSQIWQAIRRHQDGCDIDSDAFRLMKLSEEVGEVMEAFIGYHGANKRKGQTGHELTVASELCDVVITAMVALNDWVEDPELYLEMKINALTTRIELEGS
jgi:hypothetical protein